MSVVTQTTALSTTQGVVAPSVSSMTGRTPVPSLCRREGKSSSLEGLDMGLWTGKWHLSLTTYVVHGTLRYSGGCNHGCVGRWVTHITYLVVYTSLLLYYCTIVLFYHCTPGFACTAALGRLPYSYQYSLPRYSSSGSFLGALPGMNQIRHRHGCAVYTNTSGTVSIPPLSHPLHPPWSYQQICYKAKKERKKV